MVDTTQPPIGLPTRQSDSPILNAPPIPASPAGGPPSIPSVPKPPTPPGLNISIPPTSIVSEESQNVSAEKNVAYGTELRTMQQDMKSISTGSQISGAPIFPSTPLPDVGLQKSDVGTRELKTSHKLRNILFIFGFLLLGIAIMLLLSSGSNTSPTTTKTPASSSLGPPGLDEAGGPRPSASPMQSSAPIPSSTIILRTSELATIFGVPTDIYPLENTASARALFLSRVSATPVLARQLISVGTSIGGNISPSAHDILVALAGEDPLGTASSMGDDWALLVYGQTEQFDSTGMLIANAPTSRRLIFIAEAKDSIALKDAFRLWESSSFITALSAPFSYNPTLATRGFNDGTSLQQTIRYANFPNPDRSIDYAIVLAKNGKSYLVITGSRESMFIAVRWLVTQ